MSKVILGDCFKVLPTIGVESVDLCVTSPPYWGLRDYGEAFSVFGDDPLCEHEWGEEKFHEKTNRNGIGGGLTNSQDYIEERHKQGTNISQGSLCLKCGAWKGQLGLEPHPQMFIEHLVEVARLVRRVLKPSGTLWLNLGDSFFGSGAKGDHKGKEVAFSPAHGKIKSDGGWLQPKQLLMIPARVACALQDDGWILRSDVIWYKPNHMPESVTDRFTKSYEHFFMFSKEPRYYFNLDEIREKPSSTLPSGNLERKLNHQPEGRKHNGCSIPWSPANTGENNKEPYKGNNPYLFRLSENREAGNINGKNPGDVWEIPTAPFPGSHFAVFPEALVNRIIKCSSPPKGVVLDPFAGSGTTLRVAHKLGRQFIGIELNPEYAAMAEERIRGSNFRVNNEGVEKIV